MQKVTDKKIGGGPAGAEIQNINDPTARHITRERERKIDQLGEEEKLKEADLPDQQRRIRQERHKMFTDKMKGR